MQRSQRISGAKRHSQIHREGVSAANRLLVIRCLVNGLDHSRFAFVVSKRIGNAVVRNRVKRRLRAAVREWPVSPGWDAVFIARRGAQDAAYRELSRAAWNLLRRSKISAGNPRQAEGAADATANPDKGGESSR